MNEMPRLKLLGRDALPIVELVELFDINNIGPLRTSGCFLPEPAFRKSADERTAAALKPRPLAGSGSRALAFLAARGSLAVAGADAPPDPLLAVARAGNGGKR